MASCSSGCLHCGTPQLQRGHRGCRRRCTCDGGCAVIVIGGERAVGGGAGGRGRQRGGVGAEGDEWGAMELPPPTAPEPAHPPFDAPGTPSVSFRNAPGHVDLIALQRSSANALKAFWAHPGTFSCPGTYVVWAMPLVEFVCVSYPASCIIACADIRRRIFLMVFSHETD